MRLALITTLAATALATGYQLSLSEVQRLQFLSGCWEGRAGARITHESWMPPLGGMMLGMSRSVVRDTVREFEQLRIETRNGKAVYVALPSGQRETAFEAVTITESSVIFRNPAHDFPQEIAYRAVGTDSLVASIVGPQGGQVRTINFPMKRIACR